MCCCVKKIGSLIISIFAMQILFAAESKMTIGTNFWNQGWGGADSWKNGYQNAVDPDSVDSPDYNPWKSVFIEEIAFYSVLRFMDYGIINNNRQEVHWEDRTRKEAPNQRRMALYWMIDLCNRTQSDLWFCLPELTRKDYWQNAAQLIKTNLDTNLKVFVEYSNETFNGQFSAHQTCIDSGKVDNLWFPNDEGTSWGETRLAGRYATYQAIRIWETFTEVFGEETDSRLVKVLAGQAGNDWWCAILANALNHETINPNNTLPDVFAIAPYVGVSNGAASNVLELMRTEMVTSEQNIKNVRKVLNGTSQWQGQMPAHPDLNNIPMVCYEAGQHIVNNSASFAVNPDAYTWYMEYLDMLSQYMEGPMVHYTHSGAWGNMAWGAKNDIGQPAGEAPKFIALNNWYLLNVKQDPGVAYNLTVNDGLGSGSYYQGMYAFVQAEERVDSLIFEKWSGDTLLVTDILDNSTTILIQDQDIILTPLYRLAPPTTRLEAEDAELTGVEIANIREGFSGSGYIDGSTFDEEGDKITFTIDVENTGSYYLRIGYGGFYGDKHQNIYLNETDISYFSFPQTAEWETIDYGYIDLNAGINTLAIVRSWGWMDVDYIEIEGVGLTSAEKQNHRFEQDFKLNQNYPNPFNPKTVIGYQLSVNSDVQLDVCNMAGQHVVNLVSGKQAAGSHQIDFDGSHLPSGIYVYRLLSKDFVQKKKMLLMK